MHRSLSQQTWPRRRVGPLEPAVVLPLWADWNAGPARHVTRLLVRSGSAGRRAPGLPEGNRRLSLNAVPNRAAIRVVACGFVFDRTRASVRSRRRPVCTVLIAAIVDGHDLAEAYAVAIVLTTAGAGFALDDAAAETVGASPTTLARRRVVHIVLTTAIAIGWWTIIAMVVVSADSQHFPTFDIAIEVFAMTTIVWRPLRRSSPDGWCGGPTAAIVVRRSSFRRCRVPRCTGVPSLGPGQDLRDGGFDGCAALGVLLVASRDPAATKARARRGSRRGDHALCRRTPGTLNLFEHTSQAGIVYASAISIRSKRRRTRQISTPDCCERV